MGILTVIKNIFKKSDTTRNTDDVNELVGDLQFNVSVELIESSTTQKVPEDYKPPSKINWPDDDNDPVEKLLKEICGKDNKKFPLINSDYPENWLIPNFELVDFIKERLLNKDYISITRAMDGISYYDNGIIETILLKKNIPPNIQARDYYWTYNALNDVKNKKYYDYISFENDLGFIEMKALWMAIYKSIMYSDESLIDESNQYLDFMSTALACYRININGEKLFDKVLKRPAKYIKEKNNIPLPNNNFILNTDLPSPIFIERYNKLSIGARIHLYLSQIWDNNEDLKSCWKYKALRLGVLPEKTTNELLRSDFLDFEYKIVDIQLENYFDKKELLEVATNNKIEIKNGWSRIKLIEAINKYDPNIIEKLLNGSPRTKEQIFYKIKPEFQEDFEKLMKIIKDNRVVYDLLSCI